MLRNVEVAGVGEGPEGTFWDAGGLRPFGSIEVVDLMIAVGCQMAPIVVDDPLAALAGEGAEGLRLHLLTMDELSVALDQLAEDVPHGRRRGRRRGRRARVIARGASDRDRVDARSEVLDELWMIGLAVLRGLRCGPNEVDEPLFEVSNAADVLDASRGTSAIPTSDEVAFAVKRERVARSAKPAA